MSAEAAPGACAIRSPAWPSQHFTQPSPQLSWLLCLAARAVLNIPSRQPLAQRPKTGCPVSAAPARIESQREYGLCCMLPTCVDVELQGLPGGVITWPCLVCRIGVAHPQAAVAAGIPSAAPRCTLSWETRRTLSECMWPSASRSSCPMRPACRRTRPTRSRSRR